MNISKAGLDLIKQFEGCPLSAYRDSVGVITIGWGTTNSDYDITGTKIYMGMTITQAQADDWLYKSVSNKYVPKVMKYDAIYHWNQNQLDALTSFAYNIGSIDQLVNYGKRSVLEIGNKMLAYNKAGGKVLAGLTRRREAEKALFEKPVTHLKGWVQDSIGWSYYYMNNVCYKDGWQLINNEFFYFYPTGYMAQGEYIKSENYDTNKKLYYVSSDGAWDNHSYEWKQNSTGWWLAQNNGSWYAKSEWAKVDGKWYYFNDKGYMVTGTKTINGQIYSFRSDGSLVE